MLLGGCWVEGEGISDAIWSDDDEMFGLGVYRAEVRRDTQDEAASDQKVRGAKRQIYAVPSDLSEEPVPITDAEDARYSFYLMSGAGYLLVIWGFEGHHEIRQYFLDGETVVLSDTRDESPPPGVEDDCLLDAIPSPAGAYISILTECGRPDESTTSLRIIDAYSHESLLRETDVQPLQRGIWTPDDRFAYLDGVAGEALYWQEGA